MKEISITREEFRDTLCEIVGEFMKSPLDVIMLSIFSAKAETAFFGDDNEAEQIEAACTDKTKAIVLNIVFVIDNEEDDNCFVNQVVTITEVYDDGCRVFDGRKHQCIYFNNLRKVETP